MTMKWEIFVTYTMNYENPQDKESWEGGGVMTQPKMAKSLFIFFFFFFYF